jgi:ubiquitin carboxyl-terminal hydrolase 34
VYLDPEVFSNFAAWLKQHLAETAHDKSRWQLKYLADAEFFDALAKFSHNIFQYTDLFDPAIPSHPIQRIVHEFYMALTRFCIRMVSIIPKMLEEPLTRRDSVQPTGTGQDRVPFSSYLNVLEEVLDPSNCFAKMLQKSFGMNALANAENVARLLLSQDSAIASLNAILLSLSIRPRAFTDAWHVIAITISVMSRTLRCADTEYHSGDGRTQVDKMYMTIGEYVVPAVCQKHPRALPREFHNQLTKHVSCTLEITVMHRPMASVLDLYRAITQGDHALSCGIVDEPATELKLNEACRNDRATLAELIKDLWLLQVLKGYVSTDILDIKSKGIVTLRALLKHSYNTHHTKGSDHPVLQYLARFLRIGNYTEYIFSADSHASLVKECSDVVGFLAATGTYTDHETDLIWRACTTSVEAEFVKASFEVLTAMLTYVRPPQVLHMARKFAQTQASALGPYAVTFLGEAFAHFKLTNKNSEMRLAPMRIAFDILKRLDLDAPAPTTSALRHVALRQIHALKDPPHGLDQREILYAMCVSEIKRRTKHATSSMEIFATFLSKPGQEEAGHILDLLPVRLALDELVHVVRGDVKDQEGGSHTTLDSVRIHLELVIRLIGLSEFAEDKELEERLWVHTIGDAAISSLAREHALDCFISTPQHTKNPSSVEKLFLRGVDQFLPTMSVDCATLRLVAFLHSKVKEAAMALLLEDLESILEDQSWQQLLRLATTTPSDGIAAAGLSSINDILFPGHIPRDNPHAIALQAAFVRRHIDSLQSLQSLQEDQDTARRRISINRGITLLETVLRHSKAFQPKVIGDVHPIELAGSEAADRIEFTVHIHGPQGSPIARTVQALEDCHLSDLGKALQSTSGVANHDLVLNGSLARFEDISSRTLHEAGIKSSSVVSIRPRYTFDCDFSKVFASTSAVESEIRARFGLLESLLDGPHEVTERVSCTNQMLIRHY